MLEKQGLKKVIKTEWVTDSLLSCVKHKECIKVRRNAWNMPELNLKKKKKKTSESELQ